MMEGCVVRFENSWIWMLSLVIATVAAADEPTAVPVEGKPFRGTVVAARADGTFIFQTDGEKRSLRAAELVRWGACVEPDRAPVFLLHDGTLLAAGILEVDAENLALDSDSLGLVRVPREQLAAIILQLPASQLERDRLLDVAIGNEEETMRVEMLNGDRTRGTLVDLGDRSVSLRTAVGLIELEFERIGSLAFPAAGERAPGDATLVGLADGSRIRVKQFTVDGRTASLQLAGGIAWQTDVGEIVFLQPATPRIVYLSDLSPAGYRHVPYLKRTWQYRADRNVLGGLMRCGGRMYLKGIGMHTAARISYVPPQDARKFQAALGIDDLTEGMGSVRFRVFVDGNQKYVSPTVRGLEAPIPISLDLSGAERIDLVVDFADRADVQDLANWLDARFVR